MRRRTPTQNTELETLFFEETHPFEGARPGSAEWKMSYLQQTALIVLRHQVAQHSPVVDECIQASVQLVDFRRWRRGESWSISNFHSPGFDCHHSFRGASEGLELF